MLAETLEAAAHQSLAGCCASLCGGLTLLWVLTTAPLEAAWGGLPVLPDVEIT